MSPLPDDLAAYVYSALIGPRLPAYLLIEPDGALIEWGGNLDFYNIHELTRGIAVDDQVPFLAGLLPAERHPLVLPAIEVTANTSADIHIISGTRGDWVLLVDVTPQIRQQQRMQQRVNELRLLQAEGVQRAAVSPPPWPDVFASMNIAVLERLEENRLRMITPPPGWFTALWPDAVSERQDLNPAVGFPFLEHFLFDAETFWQTSTSGQLRSGFWYEADASGTEYQLEATALALGATKLLMIEYPQQAYQERQEILQKSREISLEHEHTLQEIQKKDILLHCIVHDLKSPLSVMKGAIDMLARGSISPERSRILLEAGQQQAERQNGMIQDILVAFAAEMSDLESFSVDPADAPDLLSCAQNTVESLLPAFARRKVRLHMVGSDTAFGYDWRVVGEPSRLERIFTNLLDNALRYSPKESMVTIGFDREDGMVVTTVDDQGPGIPEEMVGRLFDKFSQSKGRSGSTGLGLYFCRITVERWGGAVGAENRPEGGARLWFRLPQPGE